MTTTSRRQLGIFLAVLSLASFPLQFVWEWVQCQPYFVHGATPPTLAVMLMATLGDVVLTLLAYGGAAALHGADWPMRPWTARIWITLLSLALAMSVAVETYALQSGRWAYTDAAPRLWGSSISLLPVTQLLILFPVSFGLARWLCGLNAQRMLAR